MIKAICIDISINLYSIGLDKYVDLTLNKIYNVCIYDGELYKVKNDLNNELHYFKNRFITLQEHRNNLIKEILE